MHVVHEALPVPIGNSISISDPVEFTEATTVGALASDTAAEDEVVDEAFATAHPVFCRLTFT